MARFISQVDFDRVSILDLPDSVALGSNDVPNILAKNIEFGELSADSQHGAGKR